MLRNDYRRVLIMLRSLRAGIAGYVRLERRTLIGTMQFTVTGAREDELLYALLLYQVNGLWYAQPIGQLGPARYGQSGLVYRFDPRSIEGRALEDYTLVAVASLEDGVCDLVLAGFLNGSREVDWPQVRQAVCQSLATTSTSDRPLVDQGAPIPPICTPDCCQICPDGGAVTLPLTPGRPVVDGGAVSLPLTPDRPVLDGGAVSLPLTPDRPVVDGGAVSLPLTPDRPVVDGGAASLPLTPDRPVVDGGAVTLPLADGESPEANGRAADTQDGESDAAENAATVPTFSSEPRTVSESSESAAQTPRAADTTETTDSAPPQSAAQTPQTADTTETTDSAPPQSAAQTPQTADNAETTDSAAPDATPADEFDTPARDGARPDAFDTPARLNIGDDCENGCAAAELDTDSDQPWPACIEPLRRLYRTRASCRPFDAEGFVLIKAPIAPETGLDHCIAGLSCAGGRPDRVLYGIPARYTPEPPPGLEGYAWRGDTGGGYWVIVRPVC
ncbi:MAG: hypothetical protein PUG91_13075 [Clostridiales bacterium]|nr:hypothetical protein [Clostridiales bacterium]